MKRSALTFGSESAARSRSMPATRSRPRLIETFGCYTQFLLLRFKNGQMSKLLVGGAERPRIMIDGLFEARKRPHPLREPVLRGSWRQTLFPARPPACVAARFPVRLRAPH
ncbi:hypothetical protein WGT02_30350 (plasmid) [Rhizobium sp. T1470]|uniref:hypothetical protein n=1 Tax=unclassified Rhizobium TaxID=2613769 RepID=UPI001AAFA868|nr:hypothetical protein [Rhizobium sp. T1473]MCA0806086.1 hypothetical protein [Rhizobium sp. T1473]